MENTLQDLREKVNIFEERISRLEQSNTDIQSKLTSLNAAVERALSSFLSKTEAPLKKARIESENCSDELATDTGEADAPSSSGTKAPSASNPVTSVTEAAAAGDVVALRRMFANPNARDSNAVPALYLAASGGHVDAVGALLEGGANVEVVGPGLRTALHVAAEKGHVDVVRCLLKAKAKTETKDANGNTPLMIAAKNKHWETLRCLVAAGASVNCKDCDGQLPLNLAIKNNKIEIVKCLVTAGAEVNWKDPDGQTPLNLAIKNNKIEIVQCLVTAGAEVNWEDPDGQTPLNLATNNNKIEIVKCLVTAGANVNNVCGGQTALTQAVKNADLEMVNCLLGTGANVNCANGDGITPLVLAVKGKQWTLVRLLVENGADSNATVSNGQSALMLAAAEGHIETVAVMLRQKKPDNVVEALSYAKNGSVVWTFEDALPGVLKDEGGRAMIKAAEGGRLESMVALLDAGVDIDSKYTYECTALMGASQNGHAECVKELVQRGANLNAGGNARCAGLIVPQWSALHFASQYGHEEVVRVLLDAGADSTKRDSCGKTPLDLARSECIKDIFRNHLKHTA